MLCARTWLALLLLFLPSELCAQSRPVVETASRSTIQVFDYSRSDLGSAPVRRFAQDLRVSAYDLLVDQHFPLLLSLWARADVDFALLSMTAPAVLADRAERVSLRRATLEAKQWWGFLDFRLGRQVLVDELGWYELDGARLALELYPGLALELLGGFEVPGLGLDEHALPSQLATRSTRPSQSELFSLGAALQYRSFDWQGTLRYRHLLREQLSTTETRQLAMSLAARLLPLLSLDAELVVDAFVWQVGRLRTGASIDLGRDFSVELDYERRRPSFSSDSIFHVFEQRPLNEGSLRVRYAPHPAWLLSAQFGVLAYESLEASDEPAVDTHFGTSLSWKLSQGLRLGLTHRSRLAADSSAHLGALRADLHGLLHERLSVGTELFFAHLEKGWRPAASGQSYGASLSTRVQFDPQSALDVQLEALSHPLASAELRLMSLLDLGFWL